jgi:hypothetical protein
VAPPYRDRAFSVAYQALKKAYASKGWHVFTFPEEPVVENGYRQIVISEFDPRGCDKAASSWIAGAWDSIQKHLYRMKPNSDE